MLIFSNKNVPKTKAYYLKFKYYPLLKICIIRIGRKYVVHICLFIIYLFKDDLLVYVLLYKYTIRTREIKMI